MVKQKASKFDITLKSISKKEKKQKQIIAKADKKFNKKFLSK